MSLGHYLIGLVIFACTWGGSAYVAAVVERRRLRRLDPAPRFVALAVLFLLTLIAIHVLAGAVGLLSAPAVAVTALLVALVASRLPVAGHVCESAPTPPARRPAGRISSTLAAVGVVGTSAAVLAALIRARELPPTHIDAVSFALPEVADWIRSQSIWHVGAFLPLIQVRTYPNSGDVVSLAALLPWHDDGFLRLTAIPLLGLTGLAVHALGRELRASVATSALLGCAVVATPVIVQSAIYDLKPDVFMYATFAAGALFLLRQARTGATSDLVLAGLGLGLALGSRWYGLTAVAIVVVVWAATLLAARRPPRAVLHAGTTLGAIALATGGVWLVRNLALTGNPVYPVKLRLLGATLLSAPRDLITEKFGYTVAQRLGQPGFVTTHLLPSLRTAVGLTGALVLAGTLLAAALAVRGGRSHVRGRPLALAVAAVVVAASYAFLPGSAQGVAASPEPPEILLGTARWLAPGLVLAGGATAWAASRLAWAAGLVVDLVAFAAVVLGLHAALRTSVLGLVLAVVLIVLAARVGVAIARAPRLLAARTAGVCAVAVLVLAAIGYVHERRYDQRRYAGADAAVDWVYANARSGQRIGVSGSWPTSTFVPTYALFGPRFGNDVRYVGPVVSGQVRQYGDSEAFTAALRHDGYDLLLVGTQERPDLEHLRAPRMLADPPEARWARSAGFVEVTRDASFILLRRPAGA